MFIALLLLTQHYFAFFLTDVFSCSTNGVWGVFGDDKSWWILYWNFEVKFGLRKQDNWYWCNVLSYCGGFLEVINDKNLWCVLTDFPWKEICLLSRIWFSIVKLQRDTCKVLSSRLGMGIALSFGWMIGVGEAVQRIIQSFLSTYPKRVTVMVWDRQSRCYMTWNRKREIPSCLCWTLKVLLAFLIFTSERLIGVEFSLINLSLLLLLGANCFDYALL